MALAIAYRRTGGFHRRQRLRRMNRRKRRILCLDRLDELGAFLHLNGRTYRLPSLFTTGEPNPGLIVSDKGWRSSFATLATDILPDAHALASVDRYFVVTRYRYIPSGERVDNITPWALRQFRARYPDDDVTLDTIFAYCYAVLHDPLYREKHADDLRREFPRVPLYSDFARWVEWGEALLKLHIGYEKVKAWPIIRVEADKEPKPGAMARPILRSVAEAGEVIVDAQTKLTGIPQGAWDYRLGNRSAIDWVLDQHKEKTIKDPTVREKFNTYRFADYKESMITLLAKVVCVSVETNAITDAMRALDRGLGEGA